jgi:HlyD family secretion protein
MTRLHRALRRSQGLADPQAEAAGSSLPGLEAFSQDAGRVSAPWAFDDRPREPGPRDPGASPPPLRSPPPSPPSTPTRRRPRGSSLGRAAVAALLVVGAGLLLLELRGTGAPARAGPERLTGVVVANRVVVSARTPGRIRKLAVQEGTRVERGDTVAQLDDEELEAERARQLALVEQLSAGVRQAYDAATLEDERARGGVVAAEAQLKVTRSQRDEAAAGFDQLLKDSERLRRLFNEGLVPYQDVEQLEAEVKASAARVRSLMEQVERAEADLALARANEGRARIAWSELEQTEARLAQARAQLAQVEARFSETEVRAPLAGMVSVRVAREGEVVQAGDPIVTIADLDDVWVRAELEESALGRITLGQTLEVELASGERLSGPVTFIEPEAGFATQRDVSRVKRDIKVFGIKVALSNPERRVHHGMTAYVYLPPASAADHEVVGGRS